MIGYALAPFSVSEESVKTQALTYLSCEHRCISGHGQREATTGYSAVFAGYNLVEQGLSICNISLQPYSNIIRCISKSVQSLFHSPPPPTKIEKMCKLGFERPLHKIVFLHQHLPKIHECWTSLATGNPIIRNLTVCITRQLGVAFAHFVFTTLTLKLK